MKNISLANNPFVKITSTKPSVSRNKKVICSQKSVVNNTSALLYSLIETARANSLKPYAYLRYLFDQLPLAKTDDDYRSLLPPNLDASRLNPATA